MKRLIAVMLLAATGLIASPSPAGAVNCWKWTDGLYGYGGCNGAQSVVNILCTRAWYYGGGSYERVGKWVPSGVTGYARCDAWPWKATDPWVFTR